MLYLFPIETPESGVFGSSHDSVIRTIEGLFMAATPESSTTLLVIWHALVTSREGAGAELGILAGEGLILTLMQFASLCLLFLYRIFE